MNLLKSILINLFLVSWLSGFCQVEPLSETKNYPTITTYGIAISYFSNFDLNNIDGYSFTTTAEIKRKYHRFSIGPIWWFDKNISANIFSGGIFSYQFYPSKEFKKLNFYFVYDLYYTFKNNEWQENIEYYPNTYFETTYSNKSHSLKNLIGYGLNWNFYKSLYLLQSMSIGREFYNYSSNTNVEGNPDLSGQYSSGSIFSNSNVCSYIKIGIGYDFQK